MDPSKPAVRFVTGRLKLSRDGGIMICRKGQDACLQVCYATISQRYSAKPAHFFIEHEKVKHSLTPDYALKRIKTAI